MKTTNNLIDELSTQFETILSSLSISNINTIVSFILTSFSYDFPEIKASVYNLDSITNNRINIDTLDDNFLEVKYLIPVRSTSLMSSLLYKDILNNDIYTKIDEVFAIQMTNQYINSMSSYYVPQKPMIINDSTNDYIVLTKDSVIVYNTNRIIIPDAIKEYVYGILRPYAFYKFIEFIINSQYGKYMDINEKIFDTIYNSINTDITSGDLDKIKEVTISGLGVKFENSIDSYSSTLNSLANSFNNPDIVKQLNSYKDEQLKKFKRKKNLFYNYIF